MSHARNVKIIPASIENPTHPHTPQSVRAEANRPISAGAGKKRSDRRDMNKAYTGNVRHSARGNTPRTNVATRKD